MTKKIKSKLKPLPLEDKPNNKCRIWLLRVSLGKNKLTGRYDRPSEVFHGTYREAQARMREFITELENGTYVPKTTITFGDYSKIWLLERKETCAVNTYSGSQDRVKVLNVTLEHTRVQDITSDVVAEVYDKILNGATPSGKPASGTYANSCARCLKLILNNAIRDKLISYNPCHDVKPPSTDTKEKDAMSHAQIVSLINQLDPTQPSQLVVSLSLKTGMRRAEVHALSWGDVDFENKTISIVHGCDRNGNLKEPKSDAGIREIPISESAINDLRKRKQHMEREFADSREELKSTCPQLTNDTPIICNRLGERYQPHVTTRWWTRNRKRLGFEDWTVHELRHSYLSEMARRKVDVKVLQKLAGHARYETTMNIYTHVSLEDKRAALDVMDW